MKILIIAADGQLARQLLETFSDIEVEVVSTTKKQLDITSHKQVNSYLVTLTPDWIINCAAYTNLDLAENNIYQSNQVNAIGPENLAKNCKLIGAKFLHISTNSVFSSEHLEFFSPSGVTNPVNQYSKSKVLGEKLVLQEYPENSWIIRTSWLYGEYGGNFVHSILNKIQEKGAIRVVDDQFGQPTYSSNLATYIIDFILQPPNPGIYHFANLGYTSRFDLAAKILFFMRADAARLESAQTVEVKNKAFRSKYSLIYLNSDSYLPKKEFIHWEESLEQFLREKKGK